MDIKLEQKEKILRDYVALENNAFWEYFWVNVKGNHQNLKNDLGGATNLPEKDLRIYQGGIRAFDALLVLPDELLKIIQGEPETAPTGEQYE